MENGNGDHAANGNGVAYSHVKPLWPIYYRVLGGGPHVRFSLFSRFPRCPCTETHAYPNDLEIEELNAMVDAQGARILELEGTIVDEFARAEGARLAVVHDRGKDRALERFLKFTPPKFIGGPNPELVENWLERMTNIFAALDYTEERRVTFAAFQFEGVAQKREDEFRKLRQVASSVADYDGRFTKFSRYAPELVTNEWRRIRRIVQGLNVEIHEGLATAQISTFTEPLEKAQRVESARLQVRDFHTKKWSTPNYSSGQASKSAPPPKMGRGTGEIRTAGAPREALSSGGRNGQGQARGTPSGGQGVTSQVSCGYCGKSNHAENDCWRKLGKCLYCGSIEHQISKCPSIPKEVGSTQRPEKSASKQSSAGGSQPKVPIRVYALDYQQIPDSTEVVEDVKPTKLPYDLEVRTPTRDQSLIANLVYRDCDIWVEEWKLLADFMSLAIKGYDVILEMDWLARYHCDGPTSP
ncbi:uncharacterized protein LOC113771260 [Coffea eugenioides]|uniref:uncharacterized protein LOC113771260 n=1 Tax=Coffea eugenioides TaxID=49369 RepID=UPI000F60F7C2|nr:uncharacterized protein LOC113771260 [Coffea eugenioides]